MVFSSDKAERGQSGGEDKILSQNFGGLNITAANINCPYEDSPLLLNADVDISGRIKKRKGTKVIEEFTRTQSRGYTLIPFQTGLGYTFIMEKVGVDLVINEINDGVMTTVSTKSNVWDADAEDVKATWSVSSEVIPKVILCTGTNQPVRVSVIEAQAVATSTTTSQAFNQSQGTLQHATADSIAVFVNRELVSHTTVGYAAGTTATGGIFTVNGISVDSGDVVDVVYFGWQHMVDAMLWDGNRAFDVVTRFNTTVTDQIIEVPQGVRLEPWYGDSDDQYGLRAWSTNDYTAGNDYSLDTAREPSTSTEYAFSNGARYEYVAGKKTDPTPFFIAFGDVDGGAATPSGDVQEVYFSRLLRLDKLNGGVGVPGTELKVYVNETLESQIIANGTGSYRDYALYDDDVNLLNSTSDVGTMIYWGVTSLIGVPSDSLIKAIHITTDYIGSGANTETHIDSPYKDGTCYPIYGLGQYANYSSGSFPRNVGIFQGRMFLSGFLVSPLRVAVSETYDATTPLEFYQNFTTDSLTTAADDPFDFTINSSSNDYVTGIIGWQDSMFIFTRQAVFRVIGGENGVTNTNHRVGTLASTGMVNPYCAVITDKSLVFLSDYGVYDLFQSIESADYQAGEQSTKIREVFGITKQASYQVLPWMAYDTTNQKLYLGYPIEGFTDYSYRLFVYNTFRKSWSEYATVNGFPIFMGREYEDRTAGRNFGAMCGTQWTEGTNTFTKQSFINFESNRYVDFLAKSIANGATTTFTGHFNIYPIEHALVDNVYTYGSTAQQRQLLGSYNPIPLKEVQDVWVERETAEGTGIYNELEFGVGFQKLPNGGVYLLNHPGDNRKIRIYPNLPATYYVTGQDKYDVEEAQFYYPIHVWRDNIDSIQGVDWSRSGNDIVFDTAPDNNACIEWGLSYPTYYFSPLLSLETFNSMKRGRNIFVYFDNEEAQNLYSASDANADSGQLEAEISGRQKVETNASVAIVYENAFSADQTVDVYGFSNLRWDEALFDLNTPAPNYRRYTLFKESLLGIGYAYQLVIWSFDETTFSMVAYQIAASMHRDRFIPFSK